MSQIGRIRKNRIFGRVSGDNLTSSLKFLLAPATVSADYEHIRYTFNKSTTDCEEFFYGGCNPSPNNFETMEQCRATCVIH
ncbi:Kunitz/Bovine pancreatic trypsin inhibitor domain protein [Ancylostoma ceylanicum]|uniref:Kunitz/Bovine pancreatic trypsin inhibitor domain protein n=1 Tax=Ancylostoma ceylanicum TaxID=53326 RepID=A0A0D6L675_9BILA|nr:Kunitz/Bovine pancreatic trypsin inhibitor domain protein [Ancylostoma ceylanicum]